MPEVEPLGLPSPGDEPTNGQEDHDRPQSKTSRSRQRRVRKAEELLFRRWINWPAWWPWAMMTPTRRQMPSAA